MAKDIPTRIQRPVSSPVSTVYDIGPLAQLVQLEQTQGMQVARALSGLAPTLMNLSQTMARSEAMEGQQAAAEMPRSIKDVSEANKWFDSQNLPGPFRQMAFREAIGKQLMGQRLQSALIENRDRLTRLTDDSGQPINQAQRDQILQEIIGGLDIGEDTYVRRGFASVKDNILRQYLSQNDEIIAQKLREKNDLSIQNELTSSLIAQVQTGEIDSVAETVQKVSDRIRESGLDPSGRKQVFKGVEGYISTLLANPDTPQSELERARALVSEIIDSPEETGRPPLTPDLLASYTSLEDILDDRIDDGETVTARQVQRYEGEMYRVLSQSTGHITDAKWIETVTETTGLPEAQASQVAARLRPLLSQYNERIQRGPMSPEEFNIFRSAVERGEEIPKPVLARMGPDQLASIERFIERSPYKIEGVRDLVVVTRDGLNTELRSTASGLGMPTERASYISTLGAQEFSKILTANFRELQSSEAYLNGDSNDRFAMISTAIGQAVETARSVVMESDGYKTALQESLVSAKDRMMSVLLKEAELYSELVTRSLADTAEASDLFTMRTELYENARELAGQTIDDILEQDPDITPIELVRRVTDGLGEYRDRLIDKVEGAKVSPSGSPEPPLAEKIGVIQPPRLERKPRKLVGGNMGNAGSGVFYDTPYHNAFEEYSSVYEALATAASSDEVTDKMLQTVEEAREKYLEEARNHMDLILLEEPTSSRKIHLPGTMMYGPEGVYRGGGQRWKPAKAVGSQFQRPWKLDRGLTQEYIATKGVLADWDEVQLTPVNTTDDGDAVYTTSEGVKFYGAGSGKFPSVNPTDHLFFKDFKSLEKAYAQYLESKTGFFAQIVDLGDGDNTITPGLIYAAQRQLLPIRLGATLQNTGD